MDNIKKFLASLKGVEKDVEKCMEFLIELQRKSNTNSPAPVIEILSVIKEEHANLFDLLKKRTIMHPSLQLLMEIPIEYSIARKRLGME